MGKNPIYFGVITIIPFDNLYRRAYFAVACDKVYQLLAHGRWFSPGTPASPTTKTGHHDIAEILLKVALKHQKSNQSLHKGSIHHV
jgi:hypothetical protein